MKWSNLLSVVFVLTVFLSTRIAPCQDVKEQEREDSLSLIGDPAQSSLTSSLDWAGLNRPPRTNNTAAPSIQPAPIKILIGAGHGGKDKGAQGFRISEKDLCLRIARMVKNELQLQPQTVPLEILLTRDSDIFIPLKERVRVANERDAYLFVSIHANYSPSPKPRGFEVYFMNAEASDDEAVKLAHIENAGQVNTVKPDVLSIISDVEVTQHIGESSRFAETMFRSLATAVKPNGRGVRQGPFTVLSGTRMASVLIEVGFVSNPTEASNLRRHHYLKRLSGAISSGIVDYVDQVLRKRKPLG
ncbi:MAG: N-acetylmuramoyl-L-alanine amidase [Deltaproteobacteria bacterium]|nr:N-acetylmuramoyl-L-alanine amidase [Deltaproteobacteria bacterium]